MIGHIKQIETMGLLDGPGIRVVVFLQGCPLRCLFCHNPEMWDYNGESKEYSTIALLEVIKKYQPYFGDKGGVTFSGGEPLGQSSFLKEMIKLCHENNIHVALDTSGAVFNSDVEELIDDVDLTLLDIKGITNEEYQAMTKCSMDNYNKFLELLISKNKRLWLRVVVVPGINDTLEYINRLAFYIKEIPNVERIELLPFHKLGESKYEKLGYNNYLQHTIAMDVDKCKELETTLRDLVKQ